MKLLSVFSLVLLCISLVFAAEWDYEDNKFYYKIISNRDKTGKIYALKNKSLVDIVIPPYFTKDNKKYTINKIGENAFIHKDIESITFGSNLKNNNLEIEDNAFFGCIKLRKINFETGNIKLNPQTFNGAYEHISFDGAGIPQLVEKLGRELLSQWEVTVDRTFGTSDSALFRKKVYLYELARKMNENISHNGNNSSVAYALIYHKTTQLGMARLFRNLAIIVGVKVDDVLVAADDHCGFWNYVRIGNIWYNVDVYNFDYENENGSAVSTNKFFYTNAQYSQFLVSFVNHMFTSNIHNQPYKWVAFRDRYGNESEDLYGVKVNFNTLINDSLGGQRA